MSKSKVEPEDLNDEPSSTVIKMSKNKVEPDDLYAEHSSTVFGRYSEMTSFSGLKYISESRSLYRRLIWLLVVLLALSGLAVQIVRSVEKFIRRPTSTKLAYEERDELDFPAVTICHTNMFNQLLLSSTYGGSYRVTSEGFKDIKKLFPNPSLIDIYDDIPFPEQYRGGLSLYEFVANHAHTPYETILRCTFNDEACSQNFTTRVTNYGMCFTFNSVFQPKQVINNPGQLQGISLVLNSPALLHLPTPREHTGFKVLVHPRDEEPDMQNFGEEIDVGKHTSLRVQLREITRLTEPYGSCAKDTKTRYLRGGYTKGKCFLECETDFIVSNCSCRSFYMPGTAPYCDPHYLVNCVYPTQKHFNSRKRVICDCPDSCEESRYSVSISESSFPSEQVALYLVMNQNYCFEWAAFIDELALVAIDIYELVWGQSFSDEIITWLHNATNDAGLTLLESFPDAELWRFMSDEVYHTQVALTIAVEMASHCVVSTYLQVNPNAQHSRDCEWRAGFDDTLNNVEQLLLDSGIYQSTVASLLAITLQSYKPPNVTLSDFGNALYEDYHLEDGFMLTFSFLHTEVCGALLDEALTLAENENMFAMTTNYMREQMSMVEIYFGSMEVETITELKEYELFQFICDWGGALGLFFGASLLSFIETIDFFCRDWFQKTK